MSSLIADTSRHQAHQAAIPQRRAALIAGLAYVLLTGLVLIADVVVAWALYVFFQRTSRELSLFAAWFRLLYVAIAAAALLNIPVILKLVDGTGSVTALEKGQRDVQVM